ncbi:MAG: redoxin domain-containing protein [Planctomycetota bacterium]
MLTEKSRRGLVLLVLALTGLIALPARAADGPQKDPEAMAALKKLLDVDQELSREEQLKLLKERLPKLEKFAQKHKENEAGVTALFLVTIIATQTGDGAKAKTAAQTFLDRYPNHQAARQVERMLDKLKVVGSAAKAFVTKDLAGNEVNLVDYRGKVVFIDFFAGWCAPCRAEIPNMKKAYKKYADKKFEIIGISLDRTQAAAKSYAEKNGLNWVVTWEDPGGWKNPVARLYGVQSIPATYLLDKEGKVIATDLRGPALEAHLKKLLK